MSTTLFQNQSANDKIVPSSGGAPDSQDAGTILTIIGKDELTNLSTPLTIGDGRTLAVGDLSYQRTMTAPLNKGTGTQRVSS